ncbi:MAG: polysaccharide biosynthesis tyrosine autokinase [Pseudomonadota bacterium]
MTEIFARGPLRLGTPTFAGDDQDSVDLRSVFRRFWKDKFIFLFTMFACGLLAAVLVSRVTPQYTSMSQILLDSGDQPAVLAAQGTVDRRLNDQVMGSQISILRSNTLLESVIAEIDTIAPEALSLLDTAEADPSALRRLTTSLKAVIRPPAEDMPPEEEIARLARVDRLTWAIRRALSVWRDGDSYVISISVETPDPELSMLLAKSVADRYVGQQLESKRQSSAQAAEWIEQRVAVLRAQVQDAENAVEDYRAQSIEDTGTSYEIITQRLVSLNDDLLDARATVVAAESRLNEIERLRKDDNFEAIGNLLTSTTMPSLIAQRIDILAQDAQWSKNFDESHTGRSQLATQLEEINRAIEGETLLAIETQRNEVQIARAREQTMSASLEEAEQQFLEISRSSNGLRQLEREADVVRDLYIELLNRQTETQTKEQLQQANARIIERATLPGAPSAPRPKLMTILGLMVGAALGTGIVMVRQMSRGTFTTLAELERTTGLPVLTALPERNWPNMRAALKEINRDKVGATVESIRRLRNELSIGMAEGEPQSIALLSPLQNEGKTTTTVLLANLTEKADQLVVVVDCDFRQNTIQREFQFPMQRDMRAYLEGDCTALEALHTETGLGFDFMGLREADPGVADTVTTESLRKLFDELKKYYDTVLVNCPAVLPAAEALVIASAVDQRVMLVRHDDTPRAAMRRGLSILQNGGLDVTGQVLARIDPSLLKDSAVYSYAT